MFIRIQNIRRGFATNSSSSHSMILIGKRKPEASDPCQEAIEIAKNSIGKYEVDLAFGDGLFTLGGKLLYGLVSLVSRDHGSIPDEDYEDDIEESDEYYYVNDSEVKIRKADAASLMKEYGHLFPEFTEEVYAYAMRINLPREGWNDYQEIYDQIGRRQTPEEFISRLRDPMTYVMHISDSSG